MAVDAQTVGRNRLRRAREEDAARLKAVERARALVPRLVELCVEAGARRVILFGSLVTGHVVRGDVDLAVEGVGPAFFDLGGRLLEAVAPEHALDLVSLDDAIPESLRQRIAEEGRVLFERG